MGKQTPVEYLKQQFEKNMWSLTEEDFNKALKMEQEERERELFLRIETY